MKKLEQRVPNLRFKGFTDDWEQRKLYEVADYRNGKAHEQHIYIHGNYIVVNSKFVSTSGKAKKYSDKLIEPLMKNEIAFVLSDVPNGKALARTFLVKRSQKYTLNQRVAGITPHPNMNSYFLFILMNRNPYFLKFDDGVGQTNLSKKDVEQFNENYPTKREQQKIGEIFVKLDSLLTLQQRKLDLLKQLKKGLLQKMFAAEKNSKQPALRFKGFHDDWEQHKLGDALEEFSYRLNTPATKFDGKNKYLRITDIDDDTHAFNQISLTSPKDKDDNYILGQGDILFARTGASVGKTYMYKANDGKVYYAGFLIKGHIKNGFSTEFIFNTTRLPQYQNFVKVTSMRSGQPGINAKEYQNYVIYVPVKQEQERIGQLISKLDTLITLHQRKQNHLKLLKKSLLQQMFM